MSAVDVGCSCKCVPLYKVFHIMFLQLKHIMFQLFRSLPDCC